jgi:hypothetical protein
MAFGLNKMHKTALSLHSQVWCITILLLSYSEVSSALPAGEGFHNLLIGNAGIEKVWPAECSMWIVEP